MIFALGRTRFPNITLLDQMDSRLSERRSQFKSLVSTQLEQRKKAQKVRSDEDRMALLNSIRSSAIEPSAPSRKPPPRSLQKLFSRTFMHPDTMIDIPPNLPTQYMVLLRPEGERCLVILKNNTLSLRSRNGSMIGHEHILDPFRDLSRFDVDAIFDGVLTSSNEVFVFDVLLFNQNELVNSDFEFRQFFLNQNWPFQKTDATNVPPEAVFTEDDHSDVVPIMHRLSTHPVDKQSLETLYQNPPGYETDSLVFFSKSGKYENGLTNEAIFFRDEHLSKYAIDTQNEEGFDGHEEMEFVLVVSVDDSGSIDLKTWDKISLVRFESEGEAVAGGIGKSLIKDKAKIRVTLNLDEWKFSKFSQTRKPFATSFNRVVDQVRKRRVKQGEKDCGSLLPEIFQHSPISFLDIMTTIRNVTC